MDLLEMTRDLQLPLPPVALPEGYSVVAIHEDNGYLWEEVMDASFGDHGPGAFRFCLVANNGYEEDRVFVLLNEKGQPVATSSPWHYGMHHWYKDTFAEVAFVGVLPSYQGRRLGQLMVNHSLQKLKNRGYPVAHLGVRGTDTGENYPAVKTYLNCGFTPYIAEAEHVVAWERVYRHLGLPAPDLHYEEPAYPDIEMPHPLRPWPYQVRCAAEARRCGDVYVFGVWHMHNMYLVDVERYIDLKYLLMQSERAGELIGSIVAGHVKHIYIDRPRNPQALLLVMADGACHGVGKSADGRFEWGGEQFMHEH